MNILKALLFGFLTAASMTLAFEGRADIQTVSYVNVSQYLGDWYQIAHIPLVFEGGPCACARQRLGTTPTTGVISVVNTCTQSDGSLYTISGTASDDDTSTNAKFTVTFQGVPFNGTYWIIGLDSQYRYAVVSDEGGDALYILSKTPTLSSDLYNEAVAIGAQQVDISNLAVTDQTNCTYPQ